MSDIPGLGGSSTDARLLRAQELSQERSRNTELTARIASLEAQLILAQSKRDRSASTRFFALCFVLLIGLGSLVYLQVDSRGSGQLRGALVQQCTERNENIVATKTSLEQQAKNNEAAGQGAYAQVWRTLAQTLSTTDCATLR